ncbi:energy transducer TonB [Chitinophaga ginsengisoli]|uniref:Outer membrane transport energization protein TonB n=1 Tax=Chitinophaga ginsengisoli TaxID=363837 RepID=A0A2P8FZB0_9BACT|nr:energy transducer TonB [Chitinophaga ginsengisoli]PSL27053.1 outer membrane transport energization protein TonB [Chitinophaga ginsengisoli]
MNATNIIKSDFLDILFDGRNKDYGAYDLRRSEDRRVRNAIIGTTSIALVIIGGYVLSNKLMAADMHTRKDVAVKETILKKLEMPEEKPLTPPPPPVTTPPPPATSSIRLTPPVITEDELVRTEDEVPKLDSIGNKSIGVANIKGDDINGVVDNPFAGDGTPGNPIVEPPKVAEREEIVGWVEIMPQFPGGEEALSRFLQKNIKYPHMAQENGIEGKVFVQFVVNHEGKISEVQTVGAQKGGGLEEEAMRVVKLMPNWKPGRQNGQSVNVRYNLPIGFKLDN